MTMSKEPWLKEWATRVSKKLGLPSPEQIEKEKALRKREKPLQAKREGEKREKANHDRVYKPLYKHFAPFETNPDTGKEEKVSWDEPYNRHFGKITVSPRIVLEEYRLHTHSNICHLPAETYSDEEILRNLMKFFVDPMFNKFDATVLKKGEVEPHEFTVKRID